MNSNIARVRMSEVLKVDSINSSEGDFLATHVPFKKISFNQMDGGKENHTAASEDEIYSKIFQCDNFDEKHQFIIVEGSSGAGKSHFIRWINAKLNSSEENNDLVILIRRSDNTLKGTIKQLLLKDEIKTIKNKEIIERLTRANNTINSSKFKMDIFFKFCSQIAYDINENVNEMLSNLTKQRLLELLDVPLMRERILQSGGPIDRIYLKVASDSSDISHDVVALFDKSDFTLDIDFVEELKDKGASRHAEKLADKLIVDDDDDAFPAEIAAYMNSFVDDVIHECTGIESGDFQQIFKDIRHELKIKGKGLILLIEDITAFTGINQELLNALVTSHTGLNEEEDICRLTSIIGTTSEYYRQFRDNYRDRVTSEIKINDGAIGENKEDLVEFVARYLNVMSLEKEEINDWYKNGSSHDDYPIHDVTEGNEWDCFSLSNGKKINLYPFTINAIINLYNGMNKIRTPRYILRFIVEKAVYDVLENKAQFPSFCSGYSLSRLSTTDETQIYNYISMVYSNEEEKSKQLARIKYLITYWGNASLVSNENSYAGLSLGIYNELNLQPFIKVAYKQISKDVSQQAAANKKDNEYGANNTALSEENSRKKETDSIVNVNTKNLNKSEPSLTFKSTPLNSNHSGVMDEISIPSLENIPVLSTAEIKKREKYDIHLEKIRIWLEDKNSVLTIEQKIRDIVSKFALASINWQDAGIPYLSKTLVEESPKKLIGFEGQEKGIDNSIFVLERNRETYQLLVAFGKYYYLGSESWNFDGAASAVYIVTSWLGKNKNRFIDFVKGQTDENNIPVYIKNAIILEIYRQFLNKSYTAKFVDFSAENLLKEFSPKINTMTLGHNDKWKELLNYLYDNKIEDNHSLVINYFKTIQGSQINSNRVITRYTDLEFVLDSIKKSKLKPEFDKPDAVSAKNRPTEILKKLSERIFIVAAEEKRKAIEIYKNLLNHLGLDADDDVEEDDIKELLDDISNFYNDAISYGCNIGNMKNEIEQFKSRIKQIVYSFTVVNKSLDVDDALKLIVMYSKDPIRQLELLNRFLTQVNQDIALVESKVENDESNLQSDGIWIDGKDPRFAEEEKGFNEIYSSLIE